MYSKLLKEMQKRLEARGHEVLFTCEVSELPPNCYVASANPKFSTIYNVQRLNQSLVSAVLQSNLKLIKQLSSARKKNDVLAGPNGLPVCLSD